MTNRSPKSKRKVHPAVWIVGGIALLGGGGFALWHFFLRKPGGGDNTGGGDLVLPPVTDPGPASSPPPAGTSPAPRTSGNTDTTFPLREGMRGERVRLMQRGLNRQGAGLDPDGKWGTKTQKALVRAGVKTPITVEGWQDILDYMKIPDPYGATSGQAGGGGGGLVTSDDFWDEAKRLGAKVAAGDPSGALAILKSWPSASVYKEVSSRYVQLRFPKGSFRKTVVNALLGKSAPFSPPDKNAFRTEFLRMGLVHDSSRDTWSLPSGLGGVAFTDPLTFGQQAVTIRRTTAYDGSGRVFYLPMGMLVGTVVGHEGEFSEIVTDGGGVIMVSTESIATA